MISPSFIDKHLMQKTWLSNLMTPLGKLYEIYQTQRRKKLSSQAWHPDCFVISIGNIMSGGSGKTPFCLYLAELLKKSGIKIGVSHRGYKGTLEDTPTVISDGKQIFYKAMTCGDEAYLLASRLPEIPVVVGKQRCAAVSLLLAAFPDTEIVILDDAFQHLSIARDLDFICFDAKWGIGNGRVIPAGYLREPVTNIPLSSIIIINHKEDEEEVPQEKEWWSSFPQTSFHCWIRGKGYVDTRDNLYTAKDIKGKRCILVSGIAHPESFEHNIEKDGISWLHHFRYPDHYAFSDIKEINKLSSLCSKYQIDYILCTEKDLVKLQIYAPLKNKLRALRLQTECQDEETLLGLIKERMGN